MIQFRMRPKNSGCFSVLTMCFVMIKASNHENVKAVFRICCSCCMVSISWMTLSVSSMVVIIVITLHSRDLVWKCQIEGKASENYYQEKIQNFIKEKLDILIIKARAYFTNFKYFWWLQIQNGKKKKNNQSVFFPYFITSENHTLEFIDGISSVYNFLL